MPLVLGHNTYPVTTAPDAYDIVWVNFPYNEIPYEPGPERHPGLVLSKKVFKDNVTGIDYATLQIAYGTSKAQSHSPPWEYLHIHNFDALDRCGLWRDTYFVLSRVQRMLWAEDYFPIADHGTPILGKLPHDYILNLKQIKETRDELKKRGMI